MTALSNNKRQIKVSVIIPVYNVEGYIDTCIASLKGQTLKDLEFIFVDDCGTDASMRSVEDFAAEDSRVRIIRNPQNVGPGTSRNAGIEVARGEYYSFVDPDDWVASDYYELLYQKAITNEADIVKGTRLRVTVCDGPQKIIITTASRNTVTINKQIYKAQRHKIPLFCVFTSEHTTAIYHHRLFNNHAVRYGTTLNAEDTTFLLRVCLKQAGIKLEEIAIYYYSQRNASATGSLTKKRAFEELDSFREKVDTIEVSREQYAQRDYGLLYLVRVLPGYFTNACASRYQSEWDDNDIARYEQLLNRFMQRVEELFPHYSFYDTQLSSELWALREYGRWIPPGNGRGVIPYHDIMQSWTDFLIELPNIEKKYTVGYAKALIRALAAGLAPGKANREKASLKLICKQFRRLDAKQRHAVIMAVPYNILLFIKTRIRRLVYGFSK